jgi:hypothetical protein
VGAVAQVVAGVFGIACDAVKVVADILRIGRRKVSQDLQVPAGSVRAPCRRGADMADSAEQVSFELDIKPLFSQRDQEAMLLAFDLWDVDDVRDNADAIIAQLEAGRMPCYGAWPEEQIALFRRWMDGDCPD